MPTSSRQGTWVPRLVLLLALAAGSIGAVREAAPSSRPVLKRLVLDDFEALPGVRSYGTLDDTLPKRSRGRIEWTQQDCRPSGTAGHCMHLSYGFESERAAQVSFRIDLGDLDASDYDHVEFWIKGDAAGFSPGLKIGFRRPKPDLPRLMQDGTAVITGISDRWQRIVVPLNTMAGIAEWKHLRSFFLALESRRAGSARRGGYTIADVALLKVGGPGPTILDEVVPQKKLAWQASVGGPRRGAARSPSSAWPAGRSACSSTARELPAGDREFLERVARDTWRGLDALTDRENGLPVDHVRLSAARSRRRIPGSATTPTSPTSASI